MDDASDGNSEYCNQMNNSFLKNESLSHDSKEPTKNQGIQRSTIIQSPRKASLDDILKRIQPSLSEREWIINQRQRHVFEEKSKINITKRKCVSISNLFLFFESYSEKLFYSTLFFCTKNRCFKNTLCTYKYIYIYHINLFKENIFLK